MAYIGNSPGVASQRVVTTVTASAGQTVFTPQSGYTIGYLDVFLNGVKLVNGTDYTASNGTSVTLVSPAGSGDIVELVAALARGLTDGYTKSESDARFLGIDAETLPDQSGEAGKYLKTDGTNATWESVDSIAEIDGGFANSVYLNSQLINGGTA